MPSVPVAPQQAPPEELLDMPRVEFSMADKNFCYEIGPNDGNTHDDDQHKQFLTGKMFAPGACSCHAGKGTRMRHTQCKRVCAARPFIDKQCVTQGPRRINGVSVPYFQPVLALVSVDDDAMPKRSGTGAVRPPFFHHECTTGEEVFADFI